ncbi:hypothetical protein E4U24_003676, partial [Claviceps purpurea]
KGTEWLTETCSRGGMQRALQAGVIQPAKEIASKDVDDLTIYCMEHPGSCTQSQTLKHPKPAELPGP